jgi:hypothetical protein
MATSFAEALLKSGVVATTDIERVEKEKQQALVEEAKKREQEKRQSERIPSSAYSRPDDSEEFVKLNNMWTNERSRKFMTHLLYAFMPYTKVTSLFSFAERPRDRKCCICSANIADADEFMRKTMSTDLTNCICQELKDEVDGHPWSQEQRRTMFGNIFEGKIIGVVSDESKCVFCRPCYTSFYNWALRQLMMGNRDISKIVHKLMRQSI